MRASELREKTTEELLSILEDLRKNLFELRMKAVVEKPAKPHLFRQLRKDIARVLTILGERGVKNV